MLTLDHHRRAKVATAVLAVGAVAASPLLASATTLEQESLLAYEERLIASARDVGAVIEVGAGGAMGMKPAVGALDQGALPDDELRRAAEVWTTSIRRTADRLAAVQVPDGLGLAQRRVLRSYATYLELAETLGSIAGLPAEQRSGVLEDAVALGSRGDDEFDSAAAFIQRARRRLGLEPQASLPDPDRPLPEGVEIHDPPADPRIRDGNS